MRKFTGLALTASALLLAGCLDLTDVAELHTIADTARASLPRVSGDIPASCRRRAAIVARIPDAELPANRATLVPHCEDFAALAARVDADQAVLTDYLDALAKLASNQPLSYAANIDTATSAINGLTDASGAPANIATDTRKASLAAFTISKALANIATRHYRQKQVRQLILDTDPAIQQLTAALKEVTVTDYGIMLTSEHNFIDAYYQGPIATVDSNKSGERLALIVVQRQYDLDVLQFQTHQDAAAAYGRVMDATAALHARLAAAAREPSSFLDKLKALGPDIADLKSAVNQLKSEVK